MRMIIPVLALAVLSPGSLLADEWVVAFQVMKVEDVKKLLPEGAARLGDLKRLPLDKLEEAPSVARGFFSDPCLFYVKTEHSQIRVRASRLEYKDPRGDTVSRYEFSLSMYSQKLRKRIFDSDGAVDSVVEKSVSAKKGWQDEPYVVLLRRVDLLR